MSVKLIVHSGLPAKEKQALDEFMARHPEIACIETQPSFVSAREADLKLPNGVIATLKNDAKLSTSLLSDKQCGIAALYEIGESFSEIEHLGQRAKLADQTKVFLSKTGLGPSEADIGLPTGDYLPKHWGQDVRGWKPYLGEHGSISVVSTNSSNFEKTYYLLVSVPNLPFANEALQPLSLTPIKAFSKHENVAIALNVAQRNANRLAQLFSDTFKIELRHRRPDPRSLNGEVAAIPVAATLNNLFSHGKNHTTQIHATGVGRALEGNFTLLPVSVKHGAVLTNRRIQEPITMPVTLTTLPKKTAQEIGKTFLAERTFWNLRDRNVAPEVLLYDAPAVSIDTLAQQHGGQVLSPVFVVANQ
jgi:hypothetical protein